MILRIYMYSLGLLMGKFCPFLTVICLWHDNGRELSFYFYIFWHEIETLKFPFFFFFFFFGLGNFVKYWQFPLHNSDVVLKVLFQIISVMLSTFLLISSNSALPGLCHINLVAVCLVVAVRAGNISKLGNFKQQSILKHDYNLLICEERIENTCQTLVSE